MDTGAGLPQQLPWNGPNPYEGIPFRGPQMHMRHDDPPHLQPKYNYDPHVKVFDLSSEEDKKEYLEVLFKVTRGACQIGHEDIRFIKNKNNWVIFLRWYDIFLTAPNVEVKSNGHGQAVWNGGD